MHKSIGTPQVKVVFLTDDVKYQIVGVLDNPETEILAVSTTKTLSNPSGSFQLTMVPRKDANGKTWFDKIDIFDYTEISFKGVNDDDWKIVMRGMIDSVHKDESWEGGKPSRTITISGRDLGCLLTDFGLYFMPELDVKASLLKDVVPMGAYEEMNNTPAVCTAKDAFDFVWKIFKKAVTVKLGTARGTSIVSSFVPTLDLITKLNYKAEGMFPNDQTTIFYLRGYEGPYWNAFARWEDKPFHELFMYDGDDKSWLILRPSRLHDCNGKESPRVIELKGDKILYPDGITITADSKISIEVEKNISEVKNYFFTYPDLSFLGKISCRGWLFQPFKNHPEDCTNPFFQLDKNYSAWIGKFGFRKMEATTVFTDLDVGQVKNENSAGKKAETYQQEVLPKFLQKGINRNEALVTWYLHNQFLLSGTIVTHGTNKALIGTYLTDDDEKMEYYIEGVSHNFVILQSYTTSLTVTRGMPLNGLQTQGSFGINPMTFGKSQKIGG